MSLFEKLGLSKPVIDAVEKLGFETPTPIQEKTIPYLLQGNRDFVGLAQTGTGKTAAYGLPLLELIDPICKIPQALILSPTRELGLQIADDLKQFSKNIFELNIVCVYGGASIEEQMKKLKRGAQIIVATPGRLLDLIRRKKVNLSKLEYLILDEADEMLNMGFKEDLDAILSETSENKLTWLFSATMPKEVRSISRNYMNNPVEVTAGVANTINQNIEHHFYLMNSRDRYSALKRVVDFYPDIYGIIFCRTRKETQEIAELLMKDGYNADALHGDLSQVQRDRVMRNFKNRSLQLLVATDVAARGLDIDNLSHVIHYNLPDEMDFYTHRSGRTARAGKTGISIAMVTPREEGKITTLSKKLKTPFHKKKVPVGAEVCERQLMNFMHRVHDVDVNNEVIEPFMQNIYQELAGLDREELIKRLVSLEFNRFWNYYKDAPDLNLKKPSGDKKTSRETGEDRLFFNLGKKDGINVPHILNLIHRHCGVRGKHIGRVDMKGVYTFVNVEKKFTDEIIKGFAGVVVDERKVRIEIAGEEPTPFKRHRKRKNLKQDTFPEKPAHKKSKKERKRKQSPSRFNKAAR